MVRILFILLISTTCFSQIAPPGFYVINETIKRGKCENEINMFVGEGKACIAKKPILGIDEIEFVTDIIYDQSLKTHYIIIGLSSRGMVTLNKIFHALPKSQFVLVLENSGLGRFTIDQEITNQTMRIGDDVDLKTLTTIHMVLKKVQPIKTQ